MSDSQKYTAKLAGKHVLVIGGTSGIGFAAAEASLESGATVVIASSNQSKIDSSISRLSSSYPSKKANVSGHKCDLGDETTLEANLENLFKVATNNGSKKLDHIIFTAGKPLAIVPLGEVTLEKIRDAGTMRFCTPLLIGKHAKTYLKSSRESSFIITSGAIFQHPMKDWSIVSGYAAGLVGVGRALAIELAPIRVNTAVPGAVDTELWDSGYTTEEKEKLFQFIEGSLLTGKVPSASDIAETYLYLMRDPNITGSVVSTNGGHVMP